MARRRPAPRFVNDTELIVDRLRKILVATNYSDDARRAETRAAMLSVELNADTLELMAVQNTRMGLRTPATLATTAEVGSDEAVAMLERQEVLPALLRPDAGPACVRSLRVGNPPAALVERANEMNAGLIVVAARGKSFLASLFRRHSNDELIRLSERPVLLVHGEPKGAYRRVLVAVDFSAASQEAARMALMLAPTAHFTFLHVFRVPDEEMMLETGVSVDVVNAYRMRMREAARVRLNSFIDALGPRKQLISRSLLCGSASTVIGTHASQMSADLIAVGKHGKSRFVEFLLGSVTRRLVDRGLCDLLVAACPDTVSGDLPPAA